MDGYIPSAENTEGSGRWCDVTGSQGALGCPTGNSARDPVVPDVHLMISQMT